jgi:hypothetical protein
MQRNVGTIDLVIRGILGLALVVYLLKDNTFMPGSGLGVLIGSYLLVTSIFSFEPLYRVLGLTRFRPLDRSI